MATNHPWVRHWHWHPLNADPLVPCMVEHVPADPSQFELVERAASDWVESLRPDARSVMVRRLARFFGEQQFQKAYDTVKLYADGSKFIVDNDLICSVLVKSYGAWLMQVQRYVFNLETCQFQRWGYKEPDGRLVEINNEPWMVFSYSDTAWFFDKMNQIETYGFMEMMVTLFGQKDYRTVKKLVIQTAMRHHEQPTLSEIYSVMLEIKEGYDALMVDVQKSDPTPSGRIYILVVEG